MSIEKLQAGMILPDKIVCREIKKTETVSASGIVLPNVTRSTQTKGEIVLIGEGTPQVKMVAKVGWTALFAPLAAQKFEYENEEYLLVPQANVLFMFPPSL